MAEGDDSPLGLGMTFELVTGEDDRRVLVATYRPWPEHRGAPGFLHGGMAATCLDATMAGLGWALDRVHCVTATLNLRYRRPVPLEGSLKVEAWRDRPEARRRQRVRGRIVLPDGGVAVEAEGIFVQATLR